MRVVLAFVFVWSAFGLIAAAYILDNATMSVFYGVLFLAAQSELMRSEN